MTICCVSQHRVYEDLSKILAIENPFSFRFRLFRFFKIDLPKNKNKISIGQGWGRPRNGGRPRRVRTAVGHGGAQALAY